MIKNSLVLLALFATSFGVLANSTEPNSEEDLKEVVFVETEEEISLPFDTTQYLPEDFDAYSTLVPMKTINFMEEEIIELGFDSSKYLPSQFNPHS